MNKIRKFANYPFSFKILLIKTFYLTGYYRFIIKFRKFNNIACKLGSKHQENLINANELQVEQIITLKKALFIVCKYTPWESLCLVRAFTAKYFLRKWNIPVTVYLGVKKDKDSMILAHAWVRCKNTFVCGYTGYKDYTVTGVFSD